jgi:hypothetical protein
MKGEHIHNRNMKNIEAGRKYKTFEIERRSSAMKQKESRIKTSLKHKKADVDIYYDECVKKNKRWEDYKVNRITVIEKYVDGKRKCKITRDWAMHMPIADYCRKLATKTRWVKNRRLCG